MALTNQPALRALLQTSTDLGMPQPWGTEQSLYGALDSRAGTSDNWEQVRGCALSSPPHCSSG